MKQFFQFDFGTTRNRPFKCFDPARILCRLIGYWPISTVQHAIKAKTLKDVVNIWFELLFGPMLMIGLRDQA